MMEMLGCKIIVIYLIFNLSEQLSQNKCAIELRKQKHNWLYSHTKQANYWTIWNTKGKLTPIAVLQKVEVPPQTQVVEWKMKGMKIVE